MLILIIFTERVPARAFDNEPLADSLKVKNNMPADSTNWSLTALLHSESLYFFTGGVDQYDPSSDMLFVYDKGGWGGIIYKSFDLVNHNTGINYAMVVLHKHFYIGDNVQITPNIGVNLNQNHSVADKGSDLMGDLAVAYKLNNYFKVSNDAIFQNMGITKEYNWTNRIKLLYSEKDFYAAALLWDRNRVFHNSGYLSTGFDIGYTGIKLSSKSAIGFGASWIYMLQSDTPRRNGFQFNLGFDFGS